MAHTNGNRIHPWLNHLTALLMLPALVGCLDGSLSPKTSVSVVSDAEGLGSSSRSSGGSSSSSSSAAQAQTQKKCPWGKVCSSDNDCISNEVSYFSSYSAKTVDNVCYSVANNGAVTYSGCYRAPPEKSWIGDFWIYSSGSQTSAGIACENPNSNSVWSWNIENRTLAYCARKYSCSTTTVTAAPKSCVLDGITLAHGKSATFYSSSSVQDPNSCSAAAQVRTCNDGVLSGSAAYQYGSCANLFDDKFTCGSMALSTTQSNLLAQFDYHMVAYGDAYSQYDNRSALLGNNEPAYLDGLLDAYQATGNDKYLQRFILHGDRVISHRDDKAGYYDYRGRSAATWSDGAYSIGGQFVSYLIEDGALIASLAHFASIVNKSSCLKNIRDAKDRSFTDISSSYLTAVADTVRFHDEDRHTGTVNGYPISYYTTPTDATFILAEKAGMPVPINYQSAMGTAMAYAYGATGDSSYLAIAQSLGNFVLQEMTYNYHSSSDAYTWQMWPQMPYWPGAGMTEYSSQEDLSHGVITIEFVRAMQEQGLGVFYTTELKRIAHAYMSFVYNSGSLPLYIDGTGPSAGGQVYQYARSASLAAVEPGIWSLAYDVAITRLHTEQPGNIGSAGAFTGLARLIRYYPK